MEHDGECVVCREGRGTRDPFSLDRVLSQPLAGRLGLGAVGGDIVHISGLHSSSLCISDPSNSPRMPEERG